MLLDIEVVVGCVGPGPALQARCTNTASAVGIAAAMQGGAERFVLNQCPVDAVERFQCQPFNRCDIDVTVGQHAVGLRLTILSAVNQAHRIIVEHLDGIVSLT